MKTVVTMFIVATGLLGCKPASDAAQGSMAAENGGIEKTAAQEAARSAYIARVAQSVYSAPLHIDQSNVPLGTTPAAFFAKVPFCKHETDDAGLILDPLTGYREPLPALFPADTHGFYTGFRLRYGTVGSLSSKSASGFVLECRSKDPAMAGIPERYNLAVLRNSGSLLALEKSVTVQASSPEDAIKQVRTTLASICDGSVSPIHRSRNQMTNNLMYVTFCDRGFIRIVVASSAVDYPGSPGGMDRIVSVVYLDQVAWAEYLESERHFDQDTRQKNTTNLKKEF